MEWWSIVGGLVLLPVFAMLLRALIVRFFGLRLTDWVGYVACVAGLIAVPSWQFDVSPWLLLGLPVAATVAALQARRTLAAWRAGETVTGIFTVGRPPAGVVDRFSS